MARPAATTPVATTAVTRGFFATTAATAPMALTTWSVVFFRALLRAPRLRRDFLRRGDLVRRTMLSSTCILLRSRRLRWMDESLGSCNEEYSLTFALAPTYGCHSTDAAS